MKLHPEKYWNQLSDKGKYMGHVIFITALIFLLIFIGSSFQINIKELNPLSRSLVDYEITDIVFSKFKDHSQIELEDRIIIVDTGKPDREKIIKSLEVVSGYQPKAIGIDLLFTDYDDTSDSKLRSTFKKTKNLVLANVLSDFNIEEDRFGSIVGCHPALCDSLQTGYTNFVAKPEHTIRLFSVQEPTFKGQAYAFATQLAIAGKDLGISSLLNDENPVKRINFKGNTESFIRYDIDDLLSSRSDLSKIFQERNR